MLATTEMNHRYLASTRKCFNQYLTNLANRPVSTAMSDSELAKGTRVQNCLSVEDSLSVYFDNDLLATFIN